MDYTLITNIKFANVDHTDYPDYSDAYISSAEYNGDDMTDDQLDELNEDTNFVYERLMESLF